MSRASASLGCFRHGLVGWLFVVLVSTTFSYCCERTNNAVGSGSTVVRKRSKKSLVLKIG